MENVRQMFSGDILIIDDEVNEKDTEINRIKEFLETKRFHVIASESIPTPNELTDKKIAFVVCDWKFNNMDAKLNAQNVISFLNNINTNRLIPIFICTTVEKDEIEEYLLDENGCKKYKKNEASCVFIVKKSEIVGDNIFKVINNWIEKNPSIQYMKAWEKTIEIAKEKMFSDLYNESEFWPLVLHQCFINDGDDPTEEMGQFLSRNLFSRVSGTYKFKELEPRSIDDIQLKNILDGERTFYYQEENISDETLLHTGDIFELAGNLYINIKRQCDLLRNNEDVYLLKLDSAGKISDSPIKLSDNKENLRILGKNYNIADKPIEKINDALDKAFAKTNSFYNGKFLEKINEVIIPCVCHLDVCKIDLRSLRVISVANLKTDYKRKARLLEPYISIVTEKFASYISSKGTMRTPESLLTHKFICQDIE